MGFVIQTVSNHGTANPIVARLSIQTSDLIKWLGSDQAIQKRVTDLYIGSLQPRLLNCYDALVAIETKLRDSENYIERSRQKDPRLREIPYVEALDGDVQSFLVDAKSYLRDLIGIFEIVDEFKKLKKGKPAANEGSDFADYSGNGRSPVASWAINKFGENTLLTNYLVTSQPWITELVSLRNANEHPGGNAGTLTILNVRPDGATGTILSPTWIRVDAAGKTATDGHIIESMRNYIEKLLRFAEDLALDATIRSVGGYFVDEVPEGERDPEMPIRYRINHNALLSIITAKAKAKKQPG